MTDAHTPKLLSDADMAADLAGLPRPVSKGHATLTANQLEAVDFEDAAETIRALVSERDALAVRVREMEQENSKMVSTLAECRDIFLAPTPGGAAEHEWMQAMGCPESVPTFIRAALASKEQP